VVWPHNGVQSIFHTRYVSRLYINAIPGRKKNVRLCRQRKKEVITTPPVSPRVVNRNIKPTVLYEELLIQLYSWIWSLTSNSPHAYVHRRLRGRSASTHSSIYIFYLTIRGTAVAQWLRYCATNRKVAGSIPDGVIGNFHWYNHSDHTMALGSNQPLTEMSTRSISWG
jgi:hypothetical protein